MESESEDFTWMPVGEGMRLEFPRWAAAHSAPSHGWRFWLAAGDGDKPDSAGLPRRADVHGKSSQSSLRRGVIEIVIILFFAALLSTFLRFFVVQVYSIPTGSMQNTMMVGDRIAVNRLPVVGKQIARGDAVVFADDNAWLSDANQGLSWWQRIGQFMGIVPANGEGVLVKRVIGLGGDTVACCDPIGRLTVNGVPIDEPYLIPGAKPSAQKFSVTVPEGTIWVMGDNRSGSADSRYHLAEGEAAFVPQSAVIGKVWGVIWPFNHWGGVTERGAFADVP